MKYTLVSGLIAATLALGFPIIQNDQDFDGFDVDGGFDGFDGFDFNEKVISRNNPWEKPLPSDSMAPCPFLNSARNHGFLPRSGRNVTTDEIYNVLTNVAGLDESISNFLIKNIMDIGYTNEQGQKVLDFDSLQKHGVFEHDASLSRFDSDVGNNTIFNEEIYSHIKQFTTEKNGREYLTLRGLGKFRRFRQNECKKQHPQTFAFGLQAQVTAAGEAALIYNIFKDATGDIRMDWLDMFFTQERFPFELEWNFGKVSLKQLLSISSMIMFYQNI